MGTMPRLVGAALVAAALLAVPAHANPQEAQEGLLVEDFEDGKLDAWDIEGGHAEIEPENGNAVLEVGGATLWLKDRTLRDFSIEALVRREYQSLGGTVGF
ncbi:MAG: hypothetical protein ACE5JM_17910, partial [Armatimonadota bacterium]